MPKPRESKRKNLRLVTIEVPLNGYEAAKRGDFAISELDAKTLPARRLASKAFGAFAGWLASRGSPTPTQQQKRTHSLR